MALNVNRSVTDPFYRYKMPKLLAKVEGRGNGIKTVISNMSDIAKALERPPMYPIKYFGCELGAQINFDVKNERYIVNGEHEAAKLQGILDGFIKKFVLCPSCDNPETALTVRKNQIKSKCKACGHAFVIDSKHKLSTYIVKNPPKIEINFSKAKENGNGTAKEKEDSKETNGEMMSSNNDDDDEDWEDLDEDGTKLAAGIGKLVIDKDLDKSVEERLYMLHQLFMKHKNENTIGDGKRLADEAERLELKFKAPLLLVDVLFDENIIKDGQLKTHRRTLLRFTHTDLKAQRYLLGGIEQLIMKYEDILLLKAAQILKTLYDEDIATEEAILAWSDKPTSKYVPKSQAKKIIEKCEAVINWLKEADEESSDEEDSDVDFDDSKKHTSTLITEAAKLAEKKDAVDNMKIQTEDGEELNIEDI